MSKVRKIQIRDVSPFLQMVRNVLLGRSHNLALRFDDEISTRNPPPPKVPDGPAHGLSANYYYSRNARGEVKPPEVVHASGKLIESGESVPDTVSVKSRVPGNLWQWDAK